jgi:hypothetical protein
MHAGQLRDHELFDFGPNNQLIFSFEHEGDLKTKLSENEQCFDKPH